MRLFVALDLSSEVRAAVAALIARLAPVAREMKWVDAGNLHLTLKFIGEQPEGRVEAIIRALSAVTTAGAMEIAFRGLGFFPNERRPRVFWVGVEAPETLARLARDVDGALVPLGVAAETRSFSAHLTLARMKEPRPVPKLLEELAQLDNREFGRMTAAEFALYQSQLSPGGARYTKLRVFRL